MQLSCVPVLNQMAVCRRTGGTSHGVKPRLQNDDRTTSTDPESASDRGCECRDAIRTLSVQGRAITK